MIDVDDYSATYSTKQELKFIDGLGTWAPELKSNRSDLLAGYLRGCFKRYRWGSVDPMTVMRYAAHALLASIPKTDVHENG